MSTTLMLWALASAYGANPDTSEEPPVQPMLVGGSVVAQKDYDNVIRISVGGSGCTATVVGPRTILTAAHCGRSGATATFTIGGRRYRAQLTRNPRYPGRYRDHDLALGVLTEDIQGVTPADISGQIQVGDRIKIAGYGCYGGRPLKYDRQLRAGWSQVTGRSGDDIISRLRGGATSCYGDSGGPVFKEVNGKRQLVAVTSKGGGGTNLSSRLDSRATREFLETFARQKQLTICGVSAQCGGGTAPVPFCPPTRVSSYGGGYEK